MEIRKDGFFINGKPFRLFSGAMHYFRVPRAYWGDRFAKMRAAGFNCVETVMCWNLHEPHEGEASTLRLIAAPQRNMACMLSFDLVRIPAENGILADFRHGC